MFKEVLLSIKIKIIESISPYLLSTKTFKKDMIHNFPIIKINSNDIKYLTHSTFNVIAIDTENVRGYFRECRLHEKKHVYVKNILLDYFLYVKKYKLQKSNRIIEEIMLYLRDKKNLNTFFNMGVKNDSRSRVAQYFANPSKSSVIGIPNNHSMLLNKELPELIQFLWGEILIYKLSRKNKNNQYQTFNSSRQIATYNIAKLLGIEHLIPNTRYVVLNIDDKIIKVGTMMDIAAGISPEKLEYNERININPILQKNFSELMLLDLVCRQTDHRGGHDGNYNVEKNDEGEIFGLMAFDNDNITSFLPSSKLSFTTSAMTTPFISKKNIFEVPFLSLECIKKIKKIQRNIIKETLCNDLSNLQIYFIWLRIKRIKKCIELSQKEGCIILLKNDEWTKKTIEKEIDFCLLNDKVSYLYSFINLLY